MKTKHWLLAAVPMLCVACAGSQANSATGHQLARIEKNADMQMDSVDKRTSKRQAKVDKEFEAQKAAVSDSNMPNAERSEAMLDMSKDRSDYQVQTRAELDKLGVRIKAARDKMQVLGDKTPDPVRQELTNISTVQSTLQEQLAEMNEAAQDQWEATKSTMDNRISELDSRISDVDSQIEDSAS
jgi:hypothetical protein